MEYYSAIKKNRFESVLVSWMNLEPVIQSEVSQREKQILYINVYIWYLENCTDEPVCRAAVEMSTEDILVGTERGKAEDGKN